MKLALALRSAISASLVLLVLSACTPVPPPIRDEMARAPRGVATVVFFTDFECPFCRRTHEAFAPALAAEGARVRVVFKHVPLDRHPNARAAARAAICAERLLGPRGHAYADALFRRDALTDAANEELAIEMGVDANAFHACVESPATEERIEEDIRLFDSLGGDGVPLVFVGGERYEGAQSRLVLETALRHAIARAAPR